jgi:hypothetical protein
MFGGPSGLDPKEGRLNPMPNSAVSRRRFAEHCPAGDFQLTADLNMGRRQAPTLARKINRDYAAQKGPWSSRRVRRRSEGYLLWLYFGWTPGAEHDRAGWLG